MKVFGSANTTPDYVRAFALGKIERVVTDITSWMFKMLALVPLLHH